jgi:RNA polymerase sigma factor (sigma-70 family)
LAKLRRRAAEPEHAATAAGALDRDLLLIARWRSGEHAAGVDLLDHYAAHVRRCALRQGIAAGAEFDDFWQDLVLRLIQQLPELGERLRSSFAGYLAWQVRDLVRNRRRQRRAAPAPLADNGLVEEAPAERMAFREALTKCSGQLPDREREVFQHRFLDGLALADVAARVGSNANAVAQSVFRLVRRLRECLSKSGFDGPGDLT